MTQTILIPVNGSEHSLRAIDWLIAQTRHWKDAPVVHVLAVQPSLHGDISRFVSKAQLQEFHRAEGDKQLAAALTRLSEAGVEAEAHVRVGEAAQVIQDFATETHCDQIIIGTRGHSGLAGMLMGSVATDLAHLSPLPVTLVR